MPLRWLHGPQDVPGSFVDRQFGVRRVLERLDVAAAATGLLVFVGDGRVDPIAEPGLRPFLVTGQCTQKVGVEHARIKRQAASRVVAAARTLVRNAREG